MATALTNQATSWQGGFSQALIDLGHHWSLGKDAFSASIVTSIHSIYDDLLTLWPDEVGPQDSVVFLSRDIEAHFYKFAQTAHSDYFGLSITAGQTPDTGGQSLLYDLKRGLKLHSLGAYELSSDQTLGVGYTLLTEQVIKNHIELQERRHLTALSDLRLDQLQLWQKNFSHMLASVAADLTQSGGDPTGAISRTLNALLKQGRAFHIAINHTKAGLGNTLEHKPHLHIETQKTRETLTRQLANGDLPESLRAALRQSLKHLRDALGDKPVAQKNETLKSDKATLLHPLAPQSLSKLTLTPKSQPSSTGIKTDQISLKNKEAKSTKTIASRLKDSAKALSLSSDSRIRDVENSKTAATAQSAVQKPTTGHTVLGSIAVKSALEGKSVAPGKEALTTKSAQKLVISERKIETAGSSTNTKPAVLPGAKTGANNVMSHAGDRLQSPVAQSKDLQNADRQSKGLQKTVIQIRDSQNQTPGISAFTSHALTGHALARHATNAQTFSVQSQSRDRPSIPAPAVWATQQPDGVTRMSVNGAGLAIAQSQSSGSIPQGAASSDAQHHNATSHHDTKSGFAAGAKPEKYQAATPSDTPSHPTNQVLVQSRLDPDKSSPLPAQSRNDYGAAEQTPLTALSSINPTDGQNAKQISNQILNPVPGSDSNLGSGSAPGPGPGETSTLKLPAQQAPHAETTPQAPHEPIALAAIEAGSGTQPNAASQTAPWAALRTAADATAFNQNDVEISKNTPAESSENQQQKAFKAAAEHVCGDNCPIHGSKPQMGADLGLEITSDAIFGNSINTVDTRPLDTGTRYPDTTDTSTAGVDAAAEQNAAFKAAAEHVCGDNCPIHGSKAQVAADASREINSDDIFGSSFNSAAPATPQSDITNLIKPEELHV